MLIFPYRVLAVAAPSGGGAGFDGFDGVALGARWTTPITATSPTSVILAGGILTMKPNIAGTADTGKRGAWGIRENVASGSFEIKARLKGAYLTSGNARLCLFVANTATGKMQSFGILNYSTYSGAAYNAESIEMDYSESADWAGGAFQNFRQNALNNGYVLYKIFYDAVSSRLQFAYSLDGESSWVYLNGRAAIAQPNRRGVAIFSFDGAVPANQDINVDYVTTTEIAAPTGGYAETPTVENSSQYEAYAASRLFDKDYNTAWISAGGAAFPHLVTTKTILPRQVNRLFVACSGFGDFGDLDPTFLRAAKNFSVEGSNNDGVSWDTLGSFINASWTNYGQEKEFVMTNSGSYKWVRLRITANNGDVNYTVLSQLRFSE